MQNNYIFNSDNTLYAIGWGSQVHKKNTNWFHYNILHLNCLNKQARIQGESIPCLQYPLRTAAGRLMAFESSDVTIESAMALIPELKPTAIGYNIFGYTPYNKSWLRHESSTQFSLTNFLYFNEIGSRIGHNEVEDLLIQNKERTEENKRHIINVEPGDSGGPLFVCTKANNHCLLIGILNGSAPYSKNDMYKVTSYTTLLNPYFTEILRRSN
jgi:hypothetical protein